MRNIGTFKNAADLLDYSESLGVKLPFDLKVDTGPDAPLAKSLVLGSKTIGNRFAILPMEGWDNTLDGRPTDLTRRRWRRWGQSGAKLIFGAEAVAVCPEGKGSPTQLLMTERNLEAIAELRDHLVQSHKEQFSTTDDLVVGAQLTHSGRVSHPHDMNKPEPRILYHHPILDAQYNAHDDSALMSDEEIERVIADFIKAAKLSEDAGFDFVDIKHCHGYLGHEFLSAVARPGPYGGTFDNRTRFLREVVSGIRSEAPGLEIAVRLSAIDFLPFDSGENATRTTPCAFEGDNYPYAFGGDGTGLGTDLTEPLAFLDVLTELEIRMVGISAGAEYNSHLMEPYYSLPIAPRRPPEDPLVGAMRLMTLTAELKQKRPELIYVGAGYSYLQQWLPNVAQAVVRSGLADLVGIGRMSFCYPEIVADILAGKTVDRQRVCRTCGYCDVAPGFGLISGCYALDDFYHGRPEYGRLRQLCGEA